MNVFLDMDGVLVDFAGGACKFHGKELPYKSNREYSYDIAGLVGLEDKLFWDPLGFDFWANLEPTPWFEEVLWMVWDKFGFNNFSLLASPCKTRGCADGKIAWIEKMLPREFHRKFLIGPAKSICASENTLLIDDFEGNVDKFREHGGHAFLFPAPWNSKFGEANPAQSLRDFLGSFNEAN